MNNKFIIGVLLASMVSVGIEARQCFPPKAAADGLSSRKVEIEVDQNGHTIFKERGRRCSFYYENYYYWAYKGAGGKIPSKIDCNEDAGVVDLGKGIAPWGVFFRSRVAGQDSDVRGYKWDILGKDGSVLTSADSYNFGWIFEKEGEYKVKLEVQFKDGSTSSDTRRVTVWPRAGKTYYVDSDIGDDRNDGTSVATDAHCVRSGVAPCKGPWKTASKGLSVLAPREAVIGDDGRYGAAAVCSNSTSKEVTTNGVVTPTQACLGLRPPAKTAVHAGDQVLFKRGQTFEFEAGFVSMDAQGKASCTPLVDVGHWSTAIGLHFSAYGKAATNPLIKSTASSSTCLAALPMSGVGGFHLAFSDLEIDLESSRKDPLAPTLPNRMTFMFAPGPLMNLVINRVTLKHFNQGIVLGPVHGLFVANSNIEDSRTVHMNSTDASDVAIYGNTFNYSANHLLYMGMSNAYVVNNRFSKPAFGRTALRVYGSDPDKPRTDHVWVTDNYFSGWVDPRTPANCKEYVDGNCGQFADGKRYNYTLIDFAPNGPGQKAIDGIYFARNRVVDAEKFMSIGAAANVVIENNIFETRDKTAVHRIGLDSVFAGRPLRNILLRNNLFVERGGPEKNVARIFNVYDRDKLDCDDASGNEGVVVTDNDVVSNSPMCVLGRAPLAPGKNEVCLAQGREKGATAPTEALNGLVYARNGFKLVANDALSGQEVEAKVSRIKDSRGGKTAAP